jgi:hypothetical protein
MGFCVVRKRTLVHVSFTMHFTFTEFLLKLWSGVGVSHVGPEAIHVSDSAATLITSVGFLPCRRDLV